MAIDPDKRYRTRDGRPVQIYKVHGEQPLPVHGATYDGAPIGWTIRQWNIEGAAAYRWAERLDLIEVTLADEIRDQVPWEALRDGYRYVAADPNVEFVTWRAYSHEPELLWNRWGDHAGRIIGERLNAVKMPHVMANRWRETLIKRPEGN